MRYLIFFLSFFLSFQVCRAQYYEEPTKKDLKRQKKVERINAYEEKKAAISDLIDQKEFVIEFNKLSGKDNVPIFVSPMLNFLIVTEKQVTMQVTQDGGGGSNGVGGVTILGTVESFKVRDLGRGKPLRVQARINSPDLNGQTTFFLTLGGDEGGKVSLRNNFGQLLNLEGKIMSTAESEVYLARQRIGN